MAKPKRTKPQNPLLKRWQTPFGIPPFNVIKTKHFPPALRHVLKEHKEKIHTIANDSTRPSFANTIVALEKSFIKIDKVTDVFFNLVATDSDIELQRIEREFAPKLAVHRSKIFLNSKLFARIEELMDRRQKLKLSAEQLRLLERYHTWFKRAGADKKPKQKQRIAEIQKHLAELTTKFYQNVLADEQNWVLELKTKADRAGLPESFQSSARRAAREAGFEDANSLAITLARSSVEGFLTFSSRRDLREEAFRAWINRGNNGNETDNNQVIAEIISLRAELAKLLGYESYADFALDETMAGTPEAVRELLQKIWSPAVQCAKAEKEALATRARSEGENFKIATWDWRYYAEKERKSKFDIDEAEVRPYLQLNNMIAAAFDTARRLFSLKFKERNDIVAYHPDVRVFEALNSKGDHVALFLGDYFARPSKRSGAWMSSFRTQHKLKGDVHPIIINVMNFARGADHESTLLSLDDARTLFHEFGHALHGMLSDVTYPSISGTSVARDFVELPSQLFEHWLTQPETLSKFALHVDTGRPMPVKLQNKLKRAQNWNNGFATVEYTACAIADLELHELKPSKSFSADNFERQTLKRIKMPKEIVMRHRLPHFMHIMGGYAAGYYSYLWSEVMDADAFAAFEEEGDIYSRKIARRLKKYIYAAGNSQDPHKAYKDFRGRAPDVDALLRKRGFF